MEQADDEALTVQANPATRMSPALATTIDERSVSVKEQIHPVYVKNGSRPHREMPSLSSYQSHALASRQKAVGAIKGK